jgi:hypothetical protein
MDKIMKKNRKFITLITFAVTAVAIWISLSSFKLFIEDSTSVREEIRAYLSENVLPLIKEKRNELDQHLSSDEQAQIQEFRVKLKELRDERMAAFKDRGAGPLSEITPEMREEALERRKRHIKVRREIMMKVFEIVNNHEEEIDALLEPIEEKIPLWMADLRDIHSEFGDQNTRRNRRGPYGQQGFGGNDTDGESGGPAYSGGQGNRGGYGTGYGFMRGSGGLGGSGGMGGPRYFGGRGGFGRHGFIGFNFPFHPEIFVLFDPESIDELFENDFSALPTLSPNPTNGMVRIKLELNEAEEVSINLFDRQGTKIRNLMDKTLSEGDHELIFDISDLSQGLYFYHISLDKKVQKGRIVIE